MGTSGRRNQATTENSLEIKSKQLFHHRIYARSSAMLEAFLGRYSNIFPIFFKKKKWREGERISEYFGVDVSIYEC